MKQRRIERKAGEIAIAAEGEGYCELGVAPCCYTYLGHGVFLVLARYVGCNENVGGGEGKKTKYISR